MEEKEKLETKLSDLNCRDEEIKVNIIIKINFFSKFIFYTLI